jgi:hypothetical protein
MQRAVLTGAALLMTVSSAAFAQTNSAPIGDSAATAPMKMAAQGTEANGRNLQQQLTTNLQQSGFTDVKVMPNSFLVQATDKSGNPMTMFINPNSITEFTADNSNGQNANDSTGQIANDSAGQNANDSTGQIANNSAGQNANDSTGQTARAGAGGMFTIIPAKDDLSSQVIGLDVYNSAKQDIGKIKDVAFNAAGVKAYILGVGGFLSMGDHYVAVRPSAMTLTYDATANKWHAMMDANADELKAAPEYKYSSNL